MEHEKEIKERLTSVENQLKHKSQFSGFLKIVLTGIIVFVLLYLIAIGLYQSISG